MLLLLSQLFRQKDGGTGLSWIPVPTKLPVLDTCANEAIPKQGMGGLVNHLYLRMWPAQNTPLKDAVAS